MKIPEPVSRLGKNLLLMSGSVLFAAVLFELALRALPNPPVADIRTSFTCKDPVLRTTMRPLVRSNQAGSEWKDVVLQGNANGYRDTEWGVKRGGQRVMLLGDSFAWGWGVPFDRGMGALMERSGRLSIFNVAIPGDGINDYFVRFHVHRHTVRPDAVVVVMYVNDFFQDNLGDDLYVKRASAAQAMPPGPYNPQCIPYPLNLDNYLDSLYTFRMIRRLRASGSFGFTSEEQKKAALRRGYELDVHYLANEARRTASAFAYAEHHLSKIKSDSPAMLVVYIPPKYSVEPSARKQLEWAFAASVSNVLHPEVVERKLAALADKLGIPFLNLRESLATASRPAYWEFDGHLNEEGHAIAAREIQSRLEVLLGPRGAPPQ